MRRSFCRAPGAGRDPVAHRAAVRKNIKTGCGARRIRYVAGSLKLRFPQPMQIAVCKYRDRLIVHNLEVEFGVSPGLKPALTAAFGFDIHPLDVMVLAHRMGRAADFHIDVLAVDCDDGKVFFRDASTVLGSTSFIFRRSRSWAPGRHKSTRRNFHSVHRRKIFALKHCKYLLHSI